MLARLRLSSARIIAAILECDDEVLSADDLSALSRTLPSSEEKQRLMAPDLDVSRLPKSDAFLRDIAAIPRIKTRLETMVYRRRFDMHVAELIPDLGVLKGAADEMMRSERFKVVLAIVLKLGNRLNDGTFRGGASGFKMDTLLKVGLTDFWVETSLEEDGKTNH